MEMEMKWKWKCGQFKWRDASYCLWPTDLIPQVKSPVLEMPKIIIFSFTIMKRWCNIFNRPKYFRLSVKEHSKTSVVQLS